MVEPRFTLRALSAPLLGERPFDVVECPGSNLTARMSEQNEVALRAPPIRRLDEVRLDSCDASGEAPTQETGPYRLSSALSSETDIGRRCDSGARRGR